MWILFNLLFNHAMAMIVGPGYTVLFRTYTLLTTDARRIRETKQKSFIINGSNVMTGLQWSYDVGFQKSAIVVWYLLYSALGRR
jgi:hypothetical protein